MIRNLTFGTVQGSVLGPILFSLYMAPLLQLEDVDLYADDNYLGRKIRTLKNCSTTYRTKSTESLNGYRIRALKSMPKKLNS